MTNAPQIPSRIEEFSEVPPRLRSLYESTFDGDGNYKLGHAGSQLQAYRKALQENLGLEPPPPRSLVKLARKDWPVLLAAAEPSERRWFLHACAIGSIRIEG